MAHEYFEFDWHAAYVGGRECHSDLLRPGLRGIADMRRRQGGQSLLEFALVFPLFMTLVFGISTFGYLYYQTIAINNAAQAGARAATLETNFTTLNSAGNDCESASPITIAAAAQHGADTVPVNPGLLCNSSANPDVYTQPPGGGASVVLTITGTPANPTSFQVVVTLPIHPLAPVSPLQGTLSGHSTLS